MPDPTPDGATARPRWSTREHIEASGYEAICVPNLGQPPGCEHHDHVAGQRLPVLPTQPPQFLDDIPLARVQLAVMELLGLDSLRNVVEVQIGFGVVRAVLYATDSQGQKFRDGEQPAKYVLARRVVR